ncbi:MAG: T9SS type A sorting domain-containing protein [Rhodothermia bacterium]
MRTIAAVLVLLLTATVSQAQNFVPDGWDMIAHYPLYDSPDDVTGNYGPMQLDNAPFADSALSLNGIYSGDVRPGGYFALTPELDQMDLTAVALSVEFKTDSVQFSPVLNGGNGWRWATIWVSTDSLVFLTLNNYSTILLSQLAWSTDTWHEAAVVIQNDTASMWLDGVNGVKVFSPTDTGEDRTVTFDHAGLGDAFFGLVRNLKIYTKPGRQTTTEPMAEVPSGGIRIAAYPNPVTAASRIVIESDRAGIARVTLHDVLGRTIRSLESIRVTPGPTKIDLNAFGLPPGLYLLRAEIDAAVSTSRFVVAR